MGVDSCSSTTRRIVAHLRTPLYRNGYLLMLSAGGASLIGVAYWALAAHVYSARAVGLNSAAISAVLLLSGVGQLSLNGALARFVPVAGKRTVRLVLATYALTSLASVIAGIVFVEGMGVWAPSLRFLVARPLPFLFFLGSIVCSTIFALQDSVIAGLRRTAWIPIENVTFALVKVVLLVALATALPATGIYAAWMIPVLVSLFPVNYLIFRHLIPQSRAEREHPAMPSLRAPVMRYVAGNYAGSIAFLASTVLLPIIVTAREGAEANAHFYVAWLVGGSLQLIVINLSTSLLVEGARDAARIELYAYRVFVQTLRLLLPAVVLISIGSRYVLLVFGHGYAVSGGVLLTLVAAASLPNFLVSLYVSVARIRNAVTGLIAVQALPTVGFLLLANALLDPLGINGVGVAFLVVQSLTAGVVVSLSLWKTLARGRELHRNARRKDVLPSGQGTVA